MAALYGAKISAKLAMQETSIMKTADRQNYSLEHCNE